MATKPIEVLPGYSLTVEDAYRAFLRGEYNRLRGAPGTVWARGRDDYKIPRWFRRQFKAQIKFKRSDNARDFRRFLQRVRKALTQLRREHHASS